MTRIVTLIPLRFFLLFSIAALLAGCGIYSFKDATVPPDVKTIKIGFFENKARYVNPELSPRLTDRLQQKITNQTKLTRTNSDDAHYQVSGYVSDYSVTTTAVGGQQATTNRLTVGVHVVLRKTLENKTEEFDISRAFDFSANLSLQQAEGALLDEILRNLTDEIFNKIFSNW
ncbi:MAG: LPS assembly lipoprotein LptE [Sediminibacterium sp.]|jgi:outer membrane lipopolysaccharide assembly protein LptE/RlpB|nr:LPS assembly lipoprotein LptE [Sediminibacterium sp.]